ncbi:MAG: hypothetical protein U0X40_04365 [Ferruginibacter sp.]
MKHLNSRPETISAIADFRPNLLKANRYFNDPSLPRLTAEENPYSDKDGLIEFIVGVELVDDPVVTAKLMDLKKKLVSITSVVASYVFRYAKKYGPQYRTDPVLWAEAISNVPLMGPTKLDKQTYTRKLRGVSIATDFLKLILDIVASEGEALQTFRDFLDKQGDALRIGVDENNDFYSTFVAGITVEVFKMGEEIVYVPKIKQYRIKFDRENTKWNGLCFSVEFVDIDFDYEYGVCVFDYEALEDPEIAKAFNSFINGNQKQQIENANTYFNNDFGPDDTVA